MVSLSSITTLAQAFDLFDRSEIDAFTLDDAVYLKLTNVIGDAETLSRVLAPVADYYASRIMQFDVGNGGFAQAAYNIPDFFGPAAQGYRTLGLTEAADLIDRAAAIATQERAKFTA
ncbi:DUF4375 domain-containing protein [Pseudooceanicola sp. MF1-13]|uniref:DMP19 family protein n=1 Tax=Pseudooceanicola sp. MF1-13 TaxID=3379095 RepID=UPI0038927CB1